MRFACRFLFILLVIVPTFVMGELSPEERYGPTFYGIELPKTGARVLLIVDASKSMRRKDTRRLDKGTRWDTLVDEVKAMSYRMTEAIKENPTLCYTVSLLYDVGDDVHPGTQPYNMANPAEQTALLNNLEHRTLGNGGNFKTTFCQTLWPLVAKQHITHIFFLGDNDIASAEEDILPLFQQWYTLTAKEPQEAALKKQWRLKCDWWEPWKTWRAPNRKFAQFKKDKLLPPPPKEVLFSAVVIGQSSPLLETLSKIGKGSYIEYINPKKHKTKKKKQVLPNEG